MSDQRITCKECLKEKTNRNHVIHIQAYMLLHYGSDECIRRGCDSSVGAKSGYCTVHHKEWLHTERARNWLLGPNIERLPRTCSKCTEPVAHSTSSYCVKHRAEYMQKYNASRKGQTIQTKLDVS